jgi:GTP diphosphokinase / guanosine-3',5'-bis(diphosphate) 3'-diphosphatase
MFSAEIERTLRIAELAHRGQQRKCGQGVPYVLHPIHCALSLARLGQPEHVIQAALLHDLVEDCEGWTIERVEAEFGTRVAGIVAELTEDKTKSWEERKRWQVEHVAEMSRDALLVKAADVLHNLSTLVLDLEGAPDHGAVWSRFNAGRERTIARSRALTDALVPHVDPRLGNELEAAMVRLERLESR